MLHLFIKYTNVKNAHDCSVNILSFIRENLHIIMNSGNLITFHKITDTMLSNKSIAEELMKKGVTSLPTLISGNGEVVVGNSNIKKYMFQLQQNIPTQQPPQQQDVPEYEGYDNELYHDENSFGHMRGGDMMRETLGDEDNFSDGSKMMDMYKRRLERVQTMQSKNPAPKGMRQAPQDMEQKVNVGIEERKIGQKEDLSSSVKGLEPHEDNDLLQKLMDNIGEDNY